jgi:hypothetical protein
VVQGAAAQSARIFEVQSSAGSSLFSVDANGIAYATSQVAAPSFQRASAGTLLLGTTTNSTALTIGRSGITTTNAGTLTVSELLTGSLGATISGATINLNASSNFATNINTGTSTGAVTIGGTGTQTISVGNGAGVKTVNLGSSNTTSTTTLLSGSGGLNLNVSNNQATNINTGTSTGAVSIGNAAAGNISLQSGGTISVSGTTNINTTGTANTAIGNGTGTFALTSSGLNVTTAGAVSGVSTLATSSIITVGAVGAASNDTVLCRNGSNQIASCNSTFLTSANAFIQGGNSFTAAAVLGTNDDYGLNLRTNGVTRLAISNTGATTITGGTTGNPDALTVNNSTSTGNILNLQDNGTNVLTVADGGAVTLQNTTNSTGAFRLLNAAGDFTLLTADTSNNRLAVGNGTPANSVLTIGTNTTTASGGLYFGDDTNLYRSAAGELTTDDDFVVGSRLPLAPALMPILR